jgi:hypothetical protein
VHLVQPLRAVRIGEGDRSLRLERRGTALLSSSRKKRAPGGRRRKASGTAAALSPP